MAKKKLAVFKLTSCSGCQLPLLNFETELFDLAEAVDIACFAMASSKVEPGPYDLTLVEGSISTPQDLERIKLIREQSKILVAIGNCAVSGGPQALKNWIPLPEAKQRVYPQPHHIETLRVSTGLDEHIAVDGFLKGCPINQGQLRHYLVSVLLDKAPEISTRSVCLECKMKNNVCLIVAEGVACMGVVTSNGCGGLCPSFDRGCYGCFGPSADQNLEAFGELCRELGLTIPEIHRKYRYLNSNAEAFTQGAEMYAPEKYPSFLSPYAHTFEKGEELDAPAQH
jgi:sulfhydrogenase subunit delta